MAKDLCVLCGKETSYEFETHVDFREGYVEGSGQLCESCNGIPDVMKTITIPKNMLDKYPNNYDLGEAIRRYYFENYEWYKK